MHSQSSVKVKFFSLMCSELTSKYLEVLELTLVMSDLADHIPPNDSQEGGEVVSYPSGIEVMASLVSTISGAAPRDGIKLWLPPWCPTGRSSNVLVTTSPILDYPFNALVICIHPDGFLFPDRQSSIRVGRWNVSWDGCLESGSLVRLEDALLALLGVILLLSCGPSMS